MRRTKIVATLGPASFAPARVRELVAAGVDVFRLNLAHGSIEAQGETVGYVRAEAEAAGRVVGVMVDLPGPKMRTGPVAGGSVRLEGGTSFVLTRDDVEGDSTRVSTTVADLPSMIDVGEHIYLADGEIVLEATNVERGDVTTRVVRGGILHSRKGMHLPGAEERIDAFTGEDQAALTTLLDLEIDLVGLSFVRDGEDVERARACVRGAAHEPLIVAKIETRSAVARLGEIIAAADAVMVARGDLGIQMPLRGVPLLQKNIIRACNAAGCPVITATDMLESMTESPLPTRAEVADIANAVLDGTDALMLSGETAVGRYPVDAVTAMGEIAEATEVSGTAARHSTEIERRPGGDRVSWALARAAVEAAEEVGVAAILCPTRSGATARRVAAFRPRMPILGLAHVSSTLGALALSWGVVPYFAPFLPEGRVATEGVSRAVDVARTTGLVRPGDLVAVVSGGPEPRAGSTDLVRIVVA